MSDSPELVEYKKKVLGVAESYRATGHLCDDEFADVVAKLELQLIPKEPARGSVVVVNGQSTAFIRNFGGGWWRGDAQGDSHKSYSWTEILEVIGKRRWGVLGAANSVTGVWTPVEEIEWHQDG